MTMATDLTVGSLLRLRAREDRAQAVGRAEKIVHRRNGSVFVQVFTLHGPDAGTRGWILFAGHEMVPTLTSGHYGVCAECGLLAPCPTQLAESDARALVASADPFAAMMREAW